MLKSKSKWLSIDVLYLGAVFLMLVSYLNNSNKYDLLLLAVTTIYYFRIKIYRFKKYH